MTKLEIKDFEDFEFRPGVSIDTIARVERELGRPLPDDYKQFMMLHNGGEGPLGEEGWIRLWPIEELPSSNRDLKVSEFADGLVLIGSDGGGEAFALDYRSSGPVYVMVPLVPLSLEDTIPCGHNFAAFIALVASGKQWTD